MREPMVYEPLVTVVVTCYNYGRYLKGCLESVLSQTYKHIEILVIDDGSTDNTPEVIKPFTELSNLRYIHQSNAGQAHAKNVGIKNSNGDFIAFLDADDRWCPEKLEKQMPCFDNPNVGVVYCRARYLDENNLEFEYDMTSEYLQPRRGKVTEWLIFDNFVQFSSTVVKNNCFEELGTFDETLKMGIDWDLWLRISPSYHFDFVDERLFYYRMGHSGQMSKNMEERHRCSDRIMNNFLESHLGLVSPCTIRKANAVTCCGRGEYYRSIDRKKSTLYFLYALKINPAEMGAYKGLVKNVIQW
jgi:glycosyltransferase involved in cell wall biosynthesis